MSEEAGYLLLFFSTALVCLLLAALVGYRSMEKVLVEHITRKFIAVSDGKSALLNKEILAAKGFITERSTAPTRAESG